MDFVNGFFEFGGAILLCLNIRRILKDKSIAGVSIFPVLFFTCWGIWNLFYYPSLNQMWSFYGGCGIVTANTIWVSLSIYYSVRGRKG